MKKTRTWTDDQFRNLMGGIRVPLELPRSTIAGWVQQAAPGVVAGQRRFPLVTTNRWVWATAAAAVLALVFLLGLYLPGRLTLDSSISVSRRLAPAVSNLPVTWPASPVVLTRDPLLTANTEELLIRSAGEQLIVAGESRLTVDQDAWRNLTGNRAVTYRLEAGRLYLDHFNPLQSFTVVTPWGDTQPLGTKMSVSVSPADFLLVCLEGRLLFRPSGSDRSIIIGPNQKLHLTKTDLTNASQLAASNIESNTDIPFQPACHPATSPTAKSPVAMASPGAAASVCPSARTVSLEQPSATEQPQTAAAQLPLVQELWSANARSVNKLLASGSVVVAVSQNSLSVFGARDGGLRFQKTFPAGIYAAALSRDLYILQGKSLCSLDVDSGTQNWSISVGTTSFSNLAVRDKRLAVATAEGILYLINRDTGSLTAQIDVGIGMYGTPLLTSNGIIISTVDKRLISIHQETGKISWGFLASDRFAGDVPVLLTDSQMVLDRDLSGSWYALDLETGQLRWRSALKPPLRWGPENWNDGLLYQDATGVHFIDSSGITTPKAWFDRVGDLKATFALPNLTGMVSSSGIFALDPENQTRPARKLLDFPVLMAVVVDTMVYTMDQGGTIRAWQLNGPADKAAAR